MDHMMMIALCVQALFNTYSCMNSFIILICSIYMHCLTSNLQYVLFKVQSQHTYISVYNDFIFYCF